MARSFSATCAPDGILQHLLELRRAVPTAAGGLVFVSGPLAQRAPAVAEAVRNAWRGVPACVVPAAGVLSERGEIEGEGAAAGVLWAGGRAAPFLLGPDEVGAGPSLAGPGKEALERAGQRGATAILFAQPEAFTPSRLDDLAACAPGACVFGAGTVGGAAVGVTGAGELLAGPAAGLAITGLAAPIVEASPACRLLSSFETIEEASSGLVLRAGGRAALDLLSACTAELARRPGEPPLVFAALADEAVAPRGSGSRPTWEPPCAPNADGDDEPPRFVVRPVRGVDPGRRAVMIGEGARPGARLAFAVRDAGAARAGVEDMARRISRSALGSAPRFALYLSCAGRGQGLYGAPDVEARLLRQRFADLPLAGMHSAFEIAPWAPGQGRLALYTGVLALFRAPS
ncbi:MAG: FIST C-terminal domain-containing protein [Polyangiaceae bacterium]|nr:FIST C-terminal domain-containing protein [Polyangiaceae bacterium]